MSTKIITISAAGSVPTESTGADYNKGAPLNVTEFDQITVNLRAAVDRALGGAIGKVTLTQPATAATLTIADNKTLTCNNTITLAGTDGTTITMPSTSTALCPVAGPGSSQAFATGPLTATTASFTVGNAEGFKINSVYQYTSVGLAHAGVVEASWFYDNTASKSVFSCAGGHIFNQDVGVFGAVTPGTHNTYDLGSTGVRWRDLWLQSGAFNGSDARLKTPVRSMAPAEIQASKELAAEIGFYQWLDAIEQKGADGARIHCGLTVQRAIEIMTANGLDWTRYGFIGYDKWDDTVVEHPAIEAVIASSAEYATQVQYENVTIDGVETTIEHKRLVCIKEAVTAVEAKEAWSEVTQKSGDAYSFRYDELNQFINAGQQACIEQLEARLAALEP